MRRLPNLALIGFMGTGKSTIGRRCAATLCYQFRDTDQWIEESEGRSVREIFAQDGEPRFRELEERAVETLCREAPIVLSTGGGVPMNPRNVVNLRNSGVVALLTARPDVILLRAGDRASRPLLASADDPLATISELLARRDGEYRTAADFVVDSSDLPPEQAARKVLDGYRVRMFDERFILEPSHG
jgi:shikimate kinase